MDKFQRGEAAVRMETGRGMPCTGLAPDAAGFGGTRPVVPGYEVGRELGRGGSAAVWLVTEESTRRSFALKCVEAGLDDSGKEESIRREIRILSALDHPHLVKAYDVVGLGGVGGGRWGLVMDFAAGGSLAELSATRGKLTIGETVTILTPIAQALAYLHSQGFTHSDVSPGNVLFSGQGKPLLADLGVTRMVGDAEGVSRHGTLGFADPALNDGLGAALQPERDVYSLAAVGWYCLTGNPPPETARRPPLTLMVPEAPPELAAALEAALNADRRQRPTAREFATAVYRSAEAAPVDLSASVHPTVIPELLTRRSEPPKGHPLVRWVRYRQWRRRFTRHPARSAGAARVAGATLSTRSVGPTGSTGFMGSGASRMASGSQETRRSLRPARRRRRPRLLPALGLAVVVLSAGAGANWWLAEDFGAAAVFRADEGNLPPQTGGGRLGADPAEDTPADRPAEIPQEVREQIDSSAPDQAARGLAWLRSRAFNSGQLDLLAEVNVKGSRADEADAKTAAVLAESGHSLAGFTTTLSTVVTEPESTADRAVLSITASTSAYKEMDSSGAVVANQTATADEQLRLVLVLVDGRWRIQEILPPA